MSESDANITARSSAKRPDLDWSQVSETILMLNLAMAQIELALHDSSSSVDELTNSFTSMSGSLTAIREVAHRLPDKPAVAPIKAEIESLEADVQGKVGRAIIAFQFYDRLSQRLSHVRHSLSDLGDLVEDPSRLYLPSSWVGLQQKIRSNYVSEDDKKMFDKLMETRDVHLALEEFMKLKHEHQPTGDIELF